MCKKEWWPFELTVIVGIIFLINKIFQYNNHDFFFSLLVGHIAGFAGMCVFLFYAVQKIRHLGNENNKIFQHLAINKLVLSDILLIILLIVVSNISYKLLIGVDLVRFFEIKGHTFSHRFTGLQALIIVFFVVGTIPIGVFAEEIYFRRYLFDLQSARFKNYTWLINGFSWSFYHVLTTTNFLAFLPTCLLYSYVYQKRRNIWITIIAHLIQNSFAFYPTIKVYFSYMGIG